MGLFGFLIKAILFCLAYIKASIWRFIKFYRCVTIPDHIPDRPESIKVLDYNLSCPPTPLNPLVPGPSAVRLGGILDKISQYDVVVLQGAYQAGSGAIADFISFARSIFPYIASGPVPEFLSPVLEDAGLLILSKYPIIAHDVATFTRGSKALMGAIYAKIRFSPFENIHFIVTELDDSAETRKVQLGEILSLITKHVTDRLPIFVTGVLSAGSDWQSFASNVQHTDLIDLTTDLKGESAPYPVNTQGFLYFRPQPEDYVLASVGAAVAEFDVDRKDPKSASRAGIAATLQLVKLAE
jgi:endonuclease/exonuclease/phosphatase family metal-dependent hydrolase